jgi:hypothetical protein
VGIDVKLDNEHLLVIYPNPNNGEFKISRLNSDENRITISILDVSGRLVYRKTFVEASTALHIKTQGLSKGIYMLNYSANGVNVNKKFTID